MPNQLSLFIENLQGGGAERVMVNLANSMAEAGHFVDLVLVHSKGPYLETVSNKVQIIDLKIRRFREVLPALVRYLKQERPEAMLSALENANVASVIAKKLTNVKTRLVLSEHTTPSQHYKHSTRQPWKSFTHWGGYFYRQADAVVGVSKVVAEDLITTMGIPRKKVHFIYNPIDTSTITKLSTQEVNHPWFADSSIPVLLAVGRLTPPKDYPTLIRSFALVHKERPVRLLILGEGEERNTIEALVRQLGLNQAVALPGFATNPYAYMKRSSIFLLSSAWEGFGMVLAEAMAVGTPIVSTDCPSGPAEILEDGKWGTLVPVGDPSALAKAILKTLVNPIIPTLESVERFGIKIASEKYINLLLGNL
jgi:glycosyltransferase involved in cell wall biosynthesis